VSDWGVMGYARSKIAEDDECLFLVSRNGWLKLIIRKRTPK
jgi:hypothetical protein